MKKTIFLLVVAFSFAAFQNKAEAQSAFSLANKAKREFKSGNYIKASILSMKALMINPRKRKAQEVLSKSYELAVDDINERINMLKKSSRDFTGDETVVERARIITLYKTLQKLDKMLGRVQKMVKSPKYDINFERIEILNDLQRADESYREAVKQAAEMHYNKGDKYYRQGGRENFKKAAKEFKKALKYIKGYKDAEQRYADARKKGTMRIAIFAFDNKTGNMAYGAVGEQLADQLSAKLFKDPEAMEFVEIVSRDELGRIMAEHNLNMSSAMNQNSIAKYGKIMGVHIIIVGKITQVSATHQPAIHDAPRTVSRRVVVGQEAYVNKNGKRRTRNVYGEVYARVYEHHKSSKAILAGSYKVLDVETGKILDQDQFTEEYVWENKWITFTGDERAVRVPAGYDYNEKNPPATFEMTNMLVNSLSEKMASRIRKTLQ